MREGRDLRFPSSLKVCAIGPATAKQLKKKGIRVDYTPKEYIAEAILEGFEKMNIRGKADPLGPGEEGTGYSSKRTEKDGGRGRCG